MYFLILLNITHKILLRKFSAQLTADKNNLYSLLINERK